MESMTWSTHLPGELAEAVRDICALTGASKSKTIAMLVTLAIHGPEALGGAWPVLREALRSVGAKGASRETPPSIGERLEQLDARLDALEQAREGV